MMGVKEPTVFAILFLLFVFTSASSIFQDPFLDGNMGINNEPEFVEQIKNVTVPAGREAVLSCVVSNLGKYKVAWLRAEDQTILTLDSKVVTHNARVALTHDGPNTWNLHLRQVKQDQRGCYICQINTAEMRKQVGCIDVHVSPNIVDGETSSDLTAREGDNATLVCRATGHPPPKIIWKREDGEKITMRRGYSREGYKGHENLTGETIQFFRVDRRQMGTFLCIASNEVPPAVSKRITLDVNFSPQIVVPSQLLGAPFDTDVVLECHVESCPKAFIYWMKNRGEILGGLGLKNSTKYLIEETRVSYKSFVKLTVIGFSKKDVGIYNCMASNSVGKAEASIRLHEIKLSKSTSSATENQVVTAFATPPMSTESKSTGSRHSPDKGSLWSYDAAAPRDSGASPHDPKLEVSRKDRNDMSSSSASSISIKSNLWWFSCFQTCFLLSLLLINMILNSNSVPNSNSDSNLSPKSSAQDTLFISSPCSSSHLR